MQDEGALPGKVGEPSSSLLARQLVSQKASENSELQLVQE